MADVSPILTTRDIVTDYVVHALRTHSSGLSDRLPDRYRRHDLEAQSDATRAMRAVGKYIEQMIDDHVCKVGGEMHDDVNRILFKTKAPNTPIIDGHYSVAAVEAAIESVFEDTWKWLFLFGHEQEIHWERITILILYATNLSMLFARDSDFMCERIPFVINEISIRIDNRYRSFIEDNSGWNDGFVRWEHQYEVKDIMQYYCDKISRKTIVAIGTAAIGAGIILGSVAAALFVKKYLKRN